MVFSLQACSGSISVRSALEIAVETFANNLTDVPAYADTFNLDQGRERLAGPEAEQHKSG